MNIDPKRNKAPLSNRASSPTLMQRGANFLREKVIVKKKYKIILWKIILTVSGMLSKVFFRRDIVAKTVTNDTLFIDISKKIHWQLFFYNDYEPHIAKFVMRELKEGDLAIDVGTHIGYWTLTFSSLVGDSGKVFGFEAEPTNFEKLERNIQFNKKSNILAHHCAISNYHGRVQFRLSPYNDGGGGVANENANNTDGLDCIDVPCAELDFFLGDIDSQIKLVKIDVEGNELNVLKGMKKIFASSNRPQYLIVEIGHGSKDREEIRKIMSRHYDAYNMNENGLHKVIGNDYKTLEILFTLKGAKLADI